MKKKELPTKVETKGKDKSGHLLPRPYLLTKVWVGLLDLLLVIAIFIGIELLISKTLFSSFGYDELISKAHLLYDESGLYHFSENTGYSEIPAVYDSTKTAEENYDSVIINYYSTDERAISANKLAEYNQAKLASPYYIENEDNQIVRVSGAEESKVKYFLEIHYNKAIDFFEDDPEYYLCMHDSFMIVVYTSLFSATIATALIYLLIPLLRKDGETPWQIVFKLGLSDARDDTKVKRKQIVIRYLVILLFNVYISILFYAYYNLFTLVPIFITVLMICVTRTNSGPHDYMSQTMIVTKKDVEIPITRK